MRAGALVVHAGGRGSSLLVPQLQPALRTGEEGSAPQTAAPRAEAGAEHGHVCGRTDAFIRLQHEIINVWHLKIGIPVVCFFCHSNLNQEIPLSFSAIRRVLYLSFIYLLMNKL